MSEDNSFGAVAHPGSPPRSPRRDGGRTRQRAPLSSSSVVSRSWCWLSSPTCSLRGGGRHDEPPVRCRSLLHRPPQPRLRPTQRPSRRHTSRVRRRRRAATRSCRSRSDRPPAGTPPTGTDDHRHHRGPDTTAPPPPRRRRPLRRSPSRSSRCRDDVEDQGRQRQLQGPGGGRHLRAPASRSTRSSTTRAPGSSTATVLRALRGREHDAHEAVDQANRLIDLTGSSLRGRPGLVVHALTRVGGSTPCCAG